MNEDLPISFENVKVKLEKEFELVSTALKNLENEYKFTRLNPYDFTSKEPGYSKQEIDQEYELLANKRKKYGEATLEQKITKLKADFLERLIVVGISKFEYFGKEAESFLASDIDDELNFIDGGVKFNTLDFVTQYKLLGLEFDATFTSDIEGINTKIHALKKDLDNNNIPKLKYVYDDIREKNGLLLPKVILGCDNESINVLIKEIAQKNFNVLENNPIQDKLLIQAEAQLSAFKDRYSKKSVYYRHMTNEATDETKKEDFNLEQRLASRLFDMHSEILGLVRKAGEEKNVFTFENEKAFFSDAVHVKILDVTKNINKQKQ